MKNSLQHSFSLIQKHSSSFGHDIFDSFSVDVDKEIVDESIQCDSQSPQPTHSLHDNRHELFLHGDGFPPHSFELIFGAHDAKLLPVFQRLGLFRVSQDL